MNLPEPCGVRIQILGGFAIFSGATELKFETKKAACVVAFLVLHEGRKVHRDRLISALWADLDEERSKHNLRTALWRARRTLAAVSALRIGVEGEYVLLQTEAVSIDATEFRKTVSEANRVDGPETLGLLRKAEALYAGDLLEGLTDDDWCEEQRRNLRAMYVEVLRRLGDTLTVDASYAEATRYFEKALGQDMLDEETHRKLMLTQYLSGNRTAALSQYERLKELLRRELGVSPSSAITELAAHIRHQSGAVDHSAHESKDGRTPRGGTLAGLEDTPMIGRETEMQSVLAFLNDAAHGKGHAVVISGGLGIGKTKFVEAVIEEAKLRQFEILVGKCPDLESGSPYQVFIQALWPRISKLPHSLDTASEIVKNLVHVLSSEAPRTLPREEAIASIDSAVINECILALLCPAPDRSPTLLVLEDIHRVDRATEGLIVGLLGRIRRQRLFLLLTVRGEESRAERIISNLTSNGASVLNLYALDESQITNVVQSALKTPALPGRLLSFICERTAGIPLFALELLKFLITERYIQWDSSSGISFDEKRLDLSAPEVLSRMYEVIGRRISALRATDQGILLSAAVLGQEVAYDILEQFTGRPADDLLESIERLLAARLLVETQRGVRFPHESVRTAALSRASRIRLRRLHARAADLIEGVTPWKTIDLAWHCLEAGDDERAINYYEVSGDRARTVHANADALRCYSRALLIANPRDWTEGQILKRRAELLLKRHEVLDLTGDRTEQSRDIDEVLGIADMLHDQGLKAHAVFLQSQVLSRMNSNEQALNSALQAEALFRAVNDEGGAARASEAIGLVQMNLRNQVEAKRAFTRALTLFRRVHDRAGEARAQVSLGTVMAFYGRSVRGLHLLEAAERLFRDIHDERNLASALLQKGVLSRILGRATESESLLLSGISILQRIGDNFGQARGLSQLAATHIALGKLRQGLHESLKAIRLAAQAKDVRAQIMFRNNAAYGVFRSLGLFKQAEDSIATAIRLVTRQGRVENAAIYYDTMAAILIEKGDYDGALRWVKQAKALYRTWKGHFHFVGTEIDYRMGVAYLYLGVSKRSTPLLTKVVERWRRESDFTLICHGLSSLARSCLLEGDQTRALECAREAERILRRTDGVEQIQKVHWDQYHVFRSLGAQAAARRALRRAAQAVIDQAQPLRGRIRRRYLTDVVVNREILAERVRVGDSSTDLLSVLEDGGLRTPVRVANAPDPVAERRKKLVHLLNGERLKQKELALRLGVSVRTIRNDLAAMGRQRHAAELTDKGEV